MAIATLSIPVPSSGNGAFVDTSSLVGAKTVTLSGKFVGTYTLMGSHDSANFFPLLTFNSEAGEIQATLARSYQALRLRSSATAQSSVVASVSGISSSGVNRFSTLTSLPVGQSGYQPVIDTSLLFSPSGLEADINIGCVGAIQGTILVEGSSDGINFEAMGIFSAGKQSSRADTFNTTIDFSPINTDSNLRYIRLNVLAQILAPTIITIGGAIVLPSDVPLATTSSSGLAPYWPPQSSDLPLARASAPGAMSAAQYTLLSVGLPAIYSVTFPASPTNHQTIVIGGQTFECKATGGFVATGGGVLVVDCTGGGILGNAQNVANTFVAGINAQSANAFTGGAATSGGVVVFTAKSPGSGSDVLPTGTMSLTGTKTQAGADPVADPNATAVSLNISALGAIPMGNGQKPTVGSMNALHLASTPGWMVQASGTLGSIISNITVGAAGGVYTTPLNCDVKGAFRLTIEGSFVNAAGTVFCSLNGLSPTLGQLYGGGVLFDMYGSTPSETVTAGNYSCASMGHPAFAGALFRWTFECLRPASGFGMREFHSRWVFQGITGPLHIYVRDAIWILDETLGVGNLNSVSLQSTTPTDFASATKWQLERLP
jgi:hypothetical protein